MVLNHQFRSKLFFDIFSRYCLTRVNPLILDKVFLQIPVKVYTEEDLKLIDGFLVLEWLSLQKPFLKKINFVSNKGKYYMQVLIFVTLRKKQALNLFLFLLISFTKLQEKLLSLNLNFSYDSCYFQLKEYDSLFIYPKYLKFINYINIRLFFNENKFLLNKKFSFLKLIFYRDLWLYNFELKYCKLNWIL